MACTFEESCCVLIVKYAEERERSAPSLREAGAHYGVAT